MLYRETKTGIDISAKITVMTYEYTGANPIVVLPRVSAGDASKPVAGSATYILDATIDGSYVAPTSTVVVGVTTKATMQGRHVVLDTGDTLVIQLKGAGTDTDVNTVCTLMDVTPAQASDLTGGGEIVVNHNYGGTNNLAYRTAAGRGVDNAKVQAFTQVDYEASRRTSAFVVGESVTDTLGQWVRDMRLNAGDYMLEYYKPNEYGPDTVEVTVA